MRIPANQIKLQPPDMWHKAVAHKYAGLTTETEWKEPFFFVQLCDPQLGMMSGNVDWSDEMALCKQAVQAINRLRPKFAIVCGDLVDMWPSYDPEHPTADQGKREKQVADFKEVMGGISEDIPLVCLCGNHDVGNRPNAVTIEQYKKDFGDDYFAFWVGGCRCLVVNSNLYSNPEDAEREYAEQHAWLLHELYKAREQKATHIFLFSHHPWFISHEAEGEEGLGNWHLTTKKGFRVVLPNTYFHIPKVRRTPVLEAAKQARVTALFAGHWHQDRVLQTSSGMEMIITSAVGGQSDEGPGSGLRIVKVFRDGINHKYFTMDGLPETVPLDETKRADWEERLPEPQMPTPTLPIPEMVAEQQTAAAPAAAPAAPAYTWPQVSNVSQPPIATYAYPSSFMGQWGVSQSQFQTPSLLSPRSYSTMGWNYGSSFYSPPVPTPTFPSYNYPYSQPSMYPYGMATSSYSSFPMPQMMPQTIETPAPSMPTPSAGAHYSIPTTWPSYSMPTAYTPSYFPSSAQTPAAATYLAMSPTYIL